MAESPREQVLAAIAALGVGMVGDRYWGTPYANQPRVERAWKRPDQANYDPFFGVIQIPGSRFGGDEDDTQEAEIDHFRVLVYGYLRASGDVPASTWVERANRDWKLTLKHAVEHGGTLAGLCAQIDCDEEDVQFSTESPVAEFALPLTVKIEDALGA